MWHPRPARLPGAVPRSYPAEPTPRPALTGQPPAAALRPGPRHTAAAIGPGRAGPGRPGGRGSVRVPPAAAAALPRRAAGRRSARHGAEPARPSPPHRGRASRRRPAGVPHRRCPAGVSGSQGEAEGPREGSLDSMESRGPECGTRSSAVPGPSECPHAGSLAPRKAPRRGSLPTRARSAGLQVPCAGRSCAPRGKRWAGGIGGR